MERQDLHSNNKGGEKNPLKYLQGPVDGLKNVGRQRTHSAGHGCVEDNGLGLGDSEEEEVAPLTCGCAGF